jgi:ethanolamine ammonia-lyase small subunit
MSRPPFVTSNPWMALRQFTAARIALGRAGTSLPTAPQLAFQLAHAQARDAVHLGLAVPALQAAFAGIGFEASLSLHSAAPDRLTYLQRPDLGRRLHPDSRALLLSRHGPPAGDTPAQRPHDLAIVVADGLSALAIASHAAPLLQHLRQRLDAARWSIAPLCIVEQGRVAVADEVGELMGARAVLILIGERPGLSSPDSLGLYLTWMPRVGLSDASRNCISNVRPAGLSYAEAAGKLHHLLDQSRARQLSGVALKDETAGADELQAAASRPAFRLAPPR